MVALEEKPDNRVSRLPALGTMNVFTNPLPIHIADVYFTGEVTADRGKVKGSPTSDSYSGHSGYLYQISWKSIGPTNSFEKNPTNVNIMVA